MSLGRAVMYMVAQCFGAVCGAGLVKGSQKTYHGNGYFLNLGTGPAISEIITTFALVYTVLISSTHHDQTQRPPRDSAHLPVAKAPLPIVMVQLATIAITAGTGMMSSARIDVYILKFWVQWLLWIGPLLGAAAAAAYHQYMFQPAGSFKSSCLESVRTHADEQKISNTFRRQVM